MSETTVIHFRDWNRSDSHSIYIGREVPRKGLKRSPYANPFRISTTCDRRASVMLFENWARFSPSDEAKWIRQHVHELRGATLVCWCKEEGKHVPCHGDVLARMAEESQYAAD